jgi:hypothetical protein
VPGHLEHLRTSLNFEYRFKTNTKHKFKFLETQKQYMARTKQTARMATAQKGSMKCDAWRPKVESVKFCREPTSKVGTFTITFNWIVQVKESSSGKKVKVAYPEMHQDTMKYDENKQLLLVQGSDTGPCSQSSYKHWSIEVKKMSLKHEHFTPDELVELKNGSISQDASELCEALNTIFTKEPLVAVADNDIFTHRKKKMEIPWQEWLKCRDQIQYYVPSPSSDFSDFDMCDNTNTRDGK